jgi:hypothetical protein
LLISTRTVGRELMQISLPREGRPAVLSFESRIANEDEAPRHLSGRLNAPSAPSSASESQLCSSGGTAAGTAGSQADCSVPTATYARLVVVVHGNVPTRKPSLNPMVRLLAMATKVMRAPPGARSGALSLGPNAQAFSPDHRDV